MTFKEAFAKARKQLGAGKTFTWNGKKYSTNYAEETKSAPQSSPIPKARSSASGASSTKPKARPTRSSSKPKANPRRSSSGSSSSSPSSTRTVRDTRSSSSPRASSSQTPPAKQAGRTPAQAISRAQEIGNDYAHALKVAKRDLGRDLNSNEKSELSSHFNSGSKISTGGRARRDQRRR